MNCFDDFVDSLENHDRSKNAKSIAEAVRLFDNASELLNEILTHCEDSPQKCYEFSLLLSFVANELRGQNLQKSQQYVTLQNLIEDVNKIKNRQRASEIKIHDLSFLQSNKKRQTPFGKNKKEKKQYPNVPTSQLQLMNAGYWHADDPHTLYLSAEEKKEFKVRLNEAGLIKRDCDARKMENALYLYALSPKGGLYAFNQHDRDERLHHSTLRAGQPVICAGFLMIKNGKIVRIDNSSGHYSPPPKQLLLACMILKNQNMIDDSCKVRMHLEKEKTLGEILQEPRYAPIIDEIHSLLRSPQYTSEEKQKENVDPNQNKEIKYKHKEKYVHKPQEKIERKYKEEAERKRKEEELKRQEEAERKRQEEELKRQEEAERKRKEEELKRQEEAERKRQEEELKRQEEAERKRKEEELKRQEEAERKRQEEELKQREKTEREQREEAERKRKEEAEQKYREEAILKQKEKEARERKSVHKQPAFENHVRKSTPSMSAPRAASHHAVPAAPVAPHRVAPAAPVAPHRVAPAAPVAPHRVAPAALAFSALEKILLESIVDTPATNVSRENIEGFIRIVGNYFANNIGNVNRLSDDNKSLLTAALDKTIERETIKRHSILTIRRSSKLRHDRNIAALSEFRDKISHLPPKPPPRRPRIVG